jgi:SsrA-binding protein
MAKTEAPILKIIAQNRKASHDFHIHERLEAGIALVGSEVKSLRESAVTMADGWVEFRKQQAYLHGIQINDYPQANRWGHDVGRVRKLLLHRREIAKLAVKTQQKGFTLIPLVLYLKGAFVKVELGLVTHKKEHDKRDAKRKADDKREIDIALKRGQRGG